MEIKPIAIGAFVALLSILVIIGLTPPMDDFHPENPYWNGLSYFKEAFGLEIIEGLEEALKMVEGEPLALMIIGPSKPFSPEEIDGLKGFLTEGGLLVIADDFGTANELLDGLGLKVKLRGSLLIDPLFKEKRGFIPKIISISHRFKEKGVEELLLNYATIIEGSDVEVLASSSSFSFLDLNLNHKYDEGEPKGPFTIMAEIPYGKGKMILISDSSLFINSMLNMAENLKLAKALLDGYKPLLDISHWHRSTYSELKGYLTYSFGLLHISEVRYSMAVLAFILISRAKFKRVRKAMDMVNEMLKRHPERDRSLLEKLKGDVVHEA